MASVAFWPVSRSVSYTHLDVYKRQYGLQAFPAILKFTSTAVCNVPHVRMTLVSTMPKEEIDAGKRVCEKIGADFFVREYIDK